MVYIETTAGKLKMRY